jgi:hypothetical protein
LKDAIEGKWGGELLLQSLIELEHAPESFTTQKLVFGYLTQAIKQKATYASLIGLNALKEISLNNKQFLAVKASKQKDFRALQQLVKQLSIEQLNALYDQGIIYPPILIRLAFLYKINLEKSNSFLNQALKAEEYEIPAEELHMIGLIKIHRILVANLAKELPFLQSSKLILKKGDHFVHDGL